jgi:hypothetical protein
MQDSAVVAAVVAGDADGFVAAYDQYAASLYGYCHRVLPGPEAAEAVLDTFLIATAKLDGLRDPDRLGPWLHAVARNECLRRLGPGGEIPAAADLGDESLETPPADLRGRVLTVCADNTPAGRAHRMSVAHRAGVFGPAGFPKTIGPNGPRWWRILRQRVRRYPGVALAVAGVATLAAAAGITVVMTAGGSHRPQASGPGLGGGVPASASSTPSGATGRVPSPARTAPASAFPTSPAALAGATSAGPPAGRGTPGPTASPSGTSPSPSPSPSASSSPAQGYLLVAPARLVLTSKSGTPASGFIRLTALNGPVPHYTVRVAADPGRVKVAPAGGSLPVNGTVEVTVTVTSKVALTTHVVVGPGNLTVTVVYKPKPAPTPSPPAKA